jgi:hypothetical protein
VHVEGEEEGEGETKSEDKGEEDGEDGERKGDGEDEDMLRDDCLGGFASGNRCRVDRKVIYCLHAVCVRMCKGVETC